MRESIFKTILICTLALGGGSRSLAVDETVTVDAVIARAQSAYADSEGVSVQAYQREVRVAVRGLPSESAHFGAPTCYRLLTLRKRKPDDWYVASWIFTQNNSQMSEAAPTRHPPGFLLIKSGVNAGRLISFGGVTSEQGTKNVLTDDEFSSTLRARVLNPTAGFVSVEPLLDATAKDSIAVPFGIESPRLVGSETWKDHAVYRVEGDSRVGGQVIAWFDKETGAMLRLLFKRGVGGGPYRTMVETIYTPRLNAKLGTFDFDAQPPLEASDPLADSQMGFGPVDELKQYETNPDGSGLGVKTAPPTPVVTSPAGAEQQALSAEQMEGIVLIDGDEGTATGFMTQIKGVDFVVTNEHVLGENKKITLKNLRGETIPVMAVYGAVGSDVAILRIGKAEGRLKISEDVLKSVKIGDKVVVVGNRLGGGVATQTSGQVLGVGPTRIEVNANFEPGNSGSPIFSTVSNEVVGVATYAETRKVSVDEGTSSSSYGGRSSAPTKIEKRWYGYRLDGISKWEAIDMVRWRAQGERVDKFRDFSEALVSAIRFDFKTAAENGRLAPIIADFESKAEQMKRDRAGVAGAVKDMMRTMRSIAEAGIADFSNDDYYDYYRTCLYWEESVPMQVDYRKAIVDVLKKYEANSSAYVSRMRNGGN